MATKIGTTYGKGDDVVSDTIDVKVKELVKLPDNLLVERALNFMENSVSNTCSHLVESVCNNFKQGDVLAADNKTFVAIYVAFEELTREQG